MNKPNLYVVMDIEEADKMQTKNEHVATYPFFKQLIQYDAESVRKQWNIIYSETVQETMKKEKQND